MERKLKTCLENGQAAKFGKNILQKDSEQKVRLRPGHDLTTAGRTMSRIKA